MNRTVLKTPLHKRLRPIFFTQGYDPLNSQFFYFDWFLNFLIILKKYPAIFEILGSIQRAVCGKFISLRDFLHIFWHQKLWPSEKSKFWFFDVLKVIDISRELHFQIWDYGFNQNYSLSESLLHKRLRPKFSHKKLWFSEVSNFWLVDSFLDFSRCPIWYHTLNQNNMLLKA